jgi:hypothetical protein
MNYTVYDFYTRDEIERSLLIALLSDNYFDGFEETSETLQAYVPDEQANDETSSGDFDLERLVAHPF